MTSPPRLLAIVTIVASFLATLGHMAWRVHKDVTLRARAPELNERLAPYRSPTDPEEAPRRVFGPLVWGVDVERFLRIARESQLVGDGHHLRWFGFAFRRWAIGIFVLVRMGGSARRAEQKGGAR